jgi:hypothetical protein
MNTRDISATGFNNNQNSYAKMSVKRPVAYITELIHYEGR